MSWANIAKKNTEVKPQIKVIEKKPVKNNTEIFYKDTPESIFDMYKGSDIFDAIIDIKDDCDKYYPWILSKAKTYDIYQFLDKYIDKESSLPKNIKRYLYNEDEDESDSSDYDFY